MAVTMKHIVSNILNIAVAAMALCATATPTLAQNQQPTPGYKIPDKIMTPDKVRMPHQ
jgi:hypothetical protein